MKRNRRPGKRNVIEDLEKSDSRPKSFFRSRHRSTNYEIIVLMDDIELVGYYKDCAVVGIYPLLSIREGMGFHSKNERSSRHLVPFSLLLFLQRRFSGREKRELLRIELYRGESDDKSFVSCFLFFLRKRK